MAKGKFMQGLKGSTPKVVSAQEIDDIAEKLHQTSKAAAKPAKSKTAKSQAARNTAAVISDPKSKSKPQKKIVEPIPAVRPGLHRLTLDIPDDLFEQAKYYKLRSGVTLKGLVVSLLYDFFEQQAEQPSTARLVRRP